MTDPLTHAHGGHVHAHVHEGPHRHLLRPQRSVQTHHPSRHGHAEHGGHGHSQPLADPSIRRSRAGMRAVGLSLVVLTLTAAVQGAIFVATDSVALLADLIHNIGDAATAFPVGVAFLLRSVVAERVAGRFVVLAIFVSACVAGYEALARLLDPRTPDGLAVLAAAGLIGFAGNWLAAQIRTNAGRRLESAALIADGDHARADA